LTDGRPRVLFRIVLTDPPTLFDFTSKAALGITCRDPNPDVRRLWSGLSMFATEAQVRRTARRFPILGAFIAVLQIPDVPRVVVERTLGPGHHTVWGSPDYLVVSVVSVIVV